jgi:hypothetical protein
MEDIQTPRNSLQPSSNADRYTCHKYDSTTALYLDETEINYKIKLKLITSLAGIFFPSFKEL